jgi:hypothetical protein
VTWFRIDDGFADHPKVDALSDGPCFESAIGLWMLAGVWSAKHLTDGFVPRGRLGRIGIRRAEAAARELVRVGLWEEDPDGWRFRSWHEYQPSRAEVEEKREKTAQRVRKHREKGNADVTDDVTRYLPSADEKCNAAPVPARPGPTTLPTGESERPPPPSPVDGVKAKAIRLLKENIRQAVADHWKAEGVGAPPHVKDFDWAGWRDIAVWLMETAEGQGWDATEPNWRTERPAWLVRRFYQSKHGKTAAAQHRLTYLAGDPAQYAFEGA